MNDEPDRRAMRLLGALAFALGFLAATDSAYEMHQTDLSRPASAFEFVLAQSAIVSGLGLLQRRRWAFAASVVTAVAGFIHSVLAVILLGAALLSLLTILGMSRDPSLGVEYGLRLILILAQVLFWPILLGHQYIDLQCRASEDPEAAAGGKRTFWTCVGGAVGVTALVELILLEHPGPS